MKKILLAAIAAPLFLSACASIQVQNKASRVIISPNKPPMGCKYVSQVVGNQGNFFTGEWTSNSNLEEGAMNDMKNKAHALGANYIQLVTTRAGNTGSMSSNYGGNMTQTNVTNVGNAYVCVPSKIGL